MREAHAALGAERDRLAAELEGATAGKAHLERSLQEALEAARAREQAAMDEARAATLAVADREAAVQALGEQLAAETATRQARIEALQTEVDGLREAHETLASERDRFAADLEGAAAGKAHLEQVLDQTREHARVREEDLRGVRGWLWETAAHLDETRRSLVTQIEESAREISTLSGRVQALTTAAHDLRDAHAGAVAEGDRLAADLEGVTAAKAHLEETLQRVLEEGRSRDQDAESSLETARTQVWVTAARLAEVEQRVTGLAEERTAEVAAFTARIEGLESEADRLREVEATAAAERDRLAASLEGAAAAKAHLEEALKNALDGARSREQETGALLQETRGQAWVAAARLADIEVSLRALSEERTVEIEALAARAETLGADADRLREAEATVTNERDHLAAELAGLRASQERLEQALTEARERDEATAARLDERERELEALRGELAAALAARAAMPAEPSAAPAPPAAKRADAPAAPARPRVATPSAQRGGASETAPLAPVPAPTSRVVAVLDQDGAWKSVVTDAADVVLVMPTDESVRKVTECPGTLLVNLAAPAVMKQLVALRRMHKPMRIFGFIATGTADRVLPLGVVEPAALPLEPDAIVAAIARHAPAKARVVTVGADVDALLSLRQALARQGTSVSLAWDGKQATDLLDMVHPHAVVADLGAPHDACAVLGRLAESDPVPAAVLIDGTADVSTALAMALNNPDVAAKIVSREQLLATFRAKGGAATGAPSAGATRPAGGAVSPRTAPAPGTAR